MSGWEDWGPTYHQRIWRNLSDSIIPSSCFTNEETRFQWLRFFNLCFVFAQVKSKQGLMKRAQALNVEILSSNFTS